MNDTKPPQGKLSQLLQTNKLAIFLEIVVILFPFWIGIIIDDLIGLDHISLGGNLEFLGGPVECVPIIL